MTETEIIKRAMSIIGSRTSPAKKRASRANAKLPRKKKKKKLAISQPVAKCGA